jgi:hypothetical protein
MQHLLLAISIILLTVIAGNKHSEKKTEKVSIIIETPKAREAAVEQEPEEVETGFSIRYFVIDKYGI